MRQPSDINSPESDLPAPDLPGREPPDRDPANDPSPSEGMAPPKVSLIEEEKRQSLCLLAGGLAHDVNNHLTGIFGNVDLLLRQLPGDSACRPMVQNIERCAQHTRELMETLRCFAGRGILEPQALDLNQVIRQMTRLLEASLPSAAQLIWRLGEQLPEIQGEAEKIRRMALQLTLNAVEALGEEGGQVTVASGIEEISEAGRGDVEGGEKLASGPHVFLEVADTGRGMDEAIRRRLFDPFFSTKGRGRGMGMSMVLGVARLHYGGIRVGSAAGVGTTVRALLPLNPPEEPRPGMAAVETPQTTATGCEDAVPAAPATPTTRTVLVVDDEHFVRTVAREILEAEGMVTFGAGDGLEALAVFALHRHDIDLVLLDMTMPGLDGAETLKRLRQMEPGIRVVITSGQQPGSSVEQVAGPAAVFLRKPYRPRQLLETLDRVLGGDHV